MDHKRIYIFIGFLTVIILTAAAPILRNYMLKVHSFEPVTMTIYRNIPEHKVPFNVVGITPGGKERLFEQPVPQSEWYSHFSFYKDIYISCESTVFQSIDSIGILMGRQYYFYLHKDLSAKWTITFSNHKKVQCHIPKEIYTKAGLIRKLLSIRHWSLMQRITPVAVTLVIVLFLLLLRRFIRKWLKKSASSLLHYISAKKPTTRGLKRSAGRILHCVAAEKSITKSPGQVKPAAQGKSKSAHMPYPDIIRGKITAVCIELYRRTGVLTVSGKLIAGFYIFSLCLLMVFILTGKFFFVGYYLLLGTFTILYLLLLLIFRPAETGKDTLQNSKILLISLFIILSIAEFGLRQSKILKTYMETRGNCKYYSLYDPSIISPYYLPTPNKERIISTSEYTYKRYSNSMGLSDKEFSIEKDSGIFRIIGLGDSFTEGDGTHADSTWMRFLEYKLKPEIKRLELMNAGICGSDPFYEYKLLNEKLLKYSPNLVLVAINQSDISDIIIRGGFERFKSDSAVTYKSAPKWEFLYKHLHLVRLIANKLFKCDDLLITPKVRKQKEAEALEEIKRLLLNFKILSENKKVKIIVIFQPTKIEILNKKYYYYSSLPGYCRQNHILYIDLLDYDVNILKLTDSEVRSIFWKHDDHHNAKGYEVFAMGVEWNLKKMGVLKLRTTL